MVTEEGGQQSLEKVYESKSVLLNHDFRILPCITWDKNGFGCSYLVFLQSTMVAPLLNFPFDGP